MLSPIKHYFIKKRKGSWISENYLNLLLLIKSPIYIYFIFLLNKMVINFQKLKIKSDSHAIQIKR